MENIERIKAHYGLTAGDVKNLTSLRPLMESRRDEFVVEFYHYIKNFEEADRFLKDEATIRRHQDALKAWFVGMFSGDYGPEYFSKLEKVGLAHVKITLPAHYVNAAFHFVKSYAQGVLRKEMRDAEEAAFLERSVEKILDINLDVFTSSYIEEERRFFLSPKVESWLIQMSDRFSHGLNLVLVAGLVLLGVMVIGLFGYDFARIFQSGDYEKGFLSTLGSLLMLWVVIELMDTEVKHLRGGKLTVKIFVNVALVAVIREILIASLKHGDIEAQLSLVAALGVLGVVYWLIAKVEK